MVLAGTKEQKLGNSCGFGGPLNSVVGTHLNSITGKTIYTEQRYVKRYPTVYKEILGEEYSSELLNSVVCEQEYDPIVNLVPCFFWKL